jgi:peptidoglycan/LPS O-acetylase OafA/YrhL
VRAPTAGGPGAEVTQAGELRSARIESLRAIAALGVLLGHQFVVAEGLRFDTYWHKLIMGGGFGVDLFFALTGYLLFWPFARHVIAGGPPVNLRRYALNRALRILPLYYVVVIVLLLVQEGGGTAEQWWRFLTFTETFSDSTLLQVDGVVWSLVVELHFYVLLPFLAWGIGKLARGSAGRAALVVLALGAASLLIQAVFVGFGAPRNQILAYALPAKFYFFVPGMLLALLRLRPGGWARLMPRADLWLLAAAAAWLVLVTDYDWAPLAVVPCFLMVGAAILPLRSGPIVRALEWKWLALIGVASYSLYLWHVPILDALGGPYLKQVLLGTPIVLAVAFASYNLVEAPFLRLRKRWEGARPRFAAAAPDRTASPLPRSAPAPAQPAPRSP